MNSLAKKFRFRSTFLICFLIAFFATGVATALDEKKPFKITPPKDKAYDAIKSLAGNWTGKDEDNLSAKLSYEVISGGTAILERLTPGDYPPMLTVYHMDGSKVMMTHYCNANNQPRMRLAKFDEEKKRLEFDFVDVTNLKSPQSGYMKGLEMTISDKNHLIQVWTWNEKGKERKAVFKFNRVK